MVRWICHHKNIPACAHVLGDRRRILAINRHAQSSSFYAVPFTENSNFFVKAQEGGVVNFPRSRPSHLQYLDKSRKMNKNRQKNKSDINNTEHQKIHILLRYKVMKISCLLHIVFFEDSFA